MPLQVAYVSVATRETFSKVGRVLLAAIAAAHPNIISVLLERLQETIDKVGMVRTFRIGCFHGTVKNTLTTKAKLCPKTYSICPSVLQKCPP